MTLQEPCFWCMQAFDVDSCTIGSIIIDGVRYERVRYGYERWRADEGMDERWRKPDRCSGCGVKLQQLHHFCCTREQCPACRQELLSCMCSEVNRPKESEVADEKARDRWD